MIPKHIAALARALFKEFASDTLGKWDDQNEHVQRGYISRAYRVAKRLDNSGWSFASNVGEVNESA